MGHGIALVAAQSGFTVSLIDIEEESLKKGMGKIEKILTNSLEKGRITEKEKQEILVKIESATDFTKVKDCDLIIEAIVESLKLKKELFRKLDKICSEKTIFSSNTSTLSITKMAIKRADRFVGLHFMNPAPIMKLVEVVRGVKTSDETMEIIKALAQKMGKIPVEVSDFPGFVANRLLIPMINEAVYCLMEKVAGKEDIDKVMKTGLNHPLGPLELADLIGLDICFNIMEELHQSLADDKYRPCPLLKKMVADGFLGKKSGQGFYKYD